MKLQLGLLYDIPPKFSSLARALKSPDASPIRPSRNVCDRVDAGLQIRAASEWYCAAIGDPYARTCYSDVRILCAKDIQSG